MMLSDVHCRLLAFVVIQLRPRRAESAGLVAEFLRCVDQWGRTVVLMKDRWHDHILTEHAELAGNQDCICQALASPTEARHDIDYLDRESFYAAFILPPPWQLTYLKVSVQYMHNQLSGEATGEVITAYATPSIKKGETLKWQAPIP